MIPIMINSISFYEKKWKENVSLIIFYILIRKKKSSINFIEFQFNLSKFITTDSNRKWSQKLYRQDFGTVKLQPLQLPHNR